MAESNISPREQIIEEKKFTLTTISLLQSSNNQSRYCVIGDVGTYYQDGKHEFIFGIEHQWESEEIVAILRTNSLWIVTMSLRVREYLISGRGN